MEHIVQAIKALPKDKTGKNVFKNCCELNKPLHLTKNYYTQTSADNYYLCLDRENQNTLSLQLVDVDEDIMSEYFVLAVLEGVRDVDDCIEYYIEVL